MEYAVWRRRKGPRKEGRQEALGEEAEELRAERKWVEPLPTR